MNRSAAAFGLALLAGCATTPAPPAPIVTDVAQPLRTLSSSILGADAGALTARFGSPRLDVREGAARKLQFVGAACVLDAYLYPPGQGAEPLVTHVDARLADGRDTDRAGCIAALQAR